ncbi:MULTISPECIES: hypothetical protein [unclassified Polaromonas]|uniref:hypothetical protein n=1 Tax=unclassified Polaromonas TaxID=2638319 RepID=UPI000F08DE17|nr:MULTISPECIES: hypothetical protein [unclassified Polaromonas]AYQ28041.1 hypothetical protein DT070_08415 [Polaromonas sp. SP1]QGJ17097.1 hypothetical protein F7R28_01000 [Polaromonas sp. Pch-P]
MSIPNNPELRKTVSLNLVLSLVGVLPKTVRGITLNFDEKTIQVVFFFAVTPTENEIEDLQNVEAELVSHHEYQSEFVLKVADHSEDISGQVKNWGWIFLIRD